MKLIYLLLLFCMSYSFNDAKAQCGTDVPKHLRMVEPQKSSSGGTDFQLSAYKVYVWHKSDLRVQFMGGTAQEREYVRKVALEWARRTNIKLMFHAHPAMVRSDIRISFLKGNDSSGRPYGSYSKLGNDANNFKNQRTMNFAWLDKRTVLHEFGHALGFAHEHLRPDLNIVWNKPKVLAYTAKNYGWDAARTTSNIFNPLDLREMSSSQADKASIMTYPVLKDWTMNGFEIPTISDLSPIDIAFTNKVYRKATLKQYCNNYEPAIMFDEFKKQDLFKISSWTHSCDQTFKFYEIGAKDTKGRRIWAFKSGNKTYEWVETSRSYNSLHGAIIILVPFGKKSKERFELRKSKFTEQHVVTLTQGDANLKKYYKYHNGKIKNNYGEGFTFGQGKFYQ